MNELTMLFKAVKFSVEKHRGQRRKGVGASPSSVLLSPV